MTILCRQTALILISFFPLAALAQVTVAPTSLHIDDNIGITSIYLNNTSESSIEVNISFEFGYPGSDSTGNLRMIADSGEIKSRYDLGDNLRAFPKAMVLGPYEQQTVRVQARPMNDRPDGVYFTRLIVTTQSIAEDVETVMDEEGIETRINYVLRQNIPVFFRKGAVTTDLQVQKVDLQQEEGKLVAIATLLPNGNAPYSGSVEAFLRNSNGEIVAQQQQSVVAYFEVLRRVELMLPEGGLPPGVYTLEMHYQTRRRDISASDLVQAPPVKYTMNVTIE
jgi:P pilus assembly chaperone PapD